MKIELSIREVCVLQSALIHSQVKCERLKRVASVGLARDYARMYRENAELMNKLHAALVGKEA